VLKARLDNVARIINHAMTTIDSNADIIEQLLEHVGETVDHVGGAASAFAQAVEGCQGQLDAIAMDVQDVTITGQNAEKNRTGLIAKVDDASVN
jgi:hypothetical protein